MSTTNIRLKRSAVKNKVPTTSQLALGELAINTVDGILYFKQKDSDAVGGAESIIALSQQTSISDAGITLSASAGLTGGGSFTLNQSSADTISFNVDSSKIVTVDTGQTITGSKTFQKDVRLANNIALVLGDGRSSIVGSGPDTTFNAIGSITILADDDSATAAEYLRLQAGVNILEVGAGATQTASDLTFNGNRILTVADEGSGNGIDADTLDGQEGTYYLNYNNFSNTPTIPTVNNATITLSAGSGLTTGGNFTTNQSAAETITFNVDSSKIVTIDTAQTISGAKTFTSNVTIEKTSPVFRLLEPNTANTNFPRIDFDTNNDQGVSLEHNEFDSLLPLAGYGLVLKPSPANTQAGTGTVLSFVVQGEIYAGDSDLANVYKVWHANNDGAGTGLDADLLDGQQGTYYLNYANFSNTPTIGNATITLSAGSGLTTGGNFTTNQTSAETIEFNIDSAKIVTIDTAQTISGAKTLSGSLTLSGLSNQASEATAVVINGSNVVGTRELGSNAFTSTAYAPIASPTFTGTVTAPNITLTGLSNQAAEATALMINGSDVVGTRELGSNAFTSTSYAPSSTAVTTNTTQTISGLKTFTEEIRHNDSVGTALRIFGGNSNTTITRISATDFGLDLGDYGFSIKYEGALSANDNAYVIYADNQQAVSQVEALRIKQDGVTTLKELVVSGNLTVSGTVTTINTEEINLADNIILLNSNATGTVTENAGIEVERGDGENVLVRWDETSDRWQFTNDGTTYNNLFLPSEVVQTTSNQTIAGTKTFTSDINLQSTGTTIGITFDQSSSTDVGVDWGIRANGETLEFYEPEQSSKVQFKIIDDGGVESRHGYRVNGAFALDSNRDATLRNISGTGTVTLSGLSNQASEATALMINGSNVVGTRELGSNAFTSTSYAPIASPTFTGIVTTPDLTLTDLANQASETTALMINGSNVVGTRELGSNAFNSTSYLPLSGGTMTGDITFSDDQEGIVWSRNTDGAYIKFFNTADGDTNSRLEYATNDNGNEFHRWVHFTPGSTEHELMTLRYSGGYGNLNVTGDISVDSNLSVGGSVTLTGLANQASEATALMINGSNVVGTRELGSNAFTSTSYAPVASPTFTGIVTTPDLTLTGLANQASETTALVINGSDVVGTRELGSLAFSSATYDNYSSWTLSADGGTNQTISSGDTVDIAGGTYITTTASATDTVTIAHDNTTRADGTSTASPTHGGTFTVVDAVTTNATGHVEAINVKTVTLPSDNNTDTLQSIANDTTAADRFVTFVNSASGAQTGGSNAGLKFNPNTQDLTVGGRLSAATKSFDIPHPSKDGMRLRYGSLEGPENGVYVRGRLDGDNNVIHLPDYWLQLVDLNSITVNLTPIGRGEVWVEEILDNKITVGGNTKCFYHVYAERVDVEKLVVEYRV